MDDKLSSSSHFTDEENGASRSEITFQIQAGPNG